ncbi:MAG: hypothetical protein WA252_20485 [Candidatus Sulfotelmatobacter sp.]
MYLVYALMGFSALVGIALLAGLVWLSIVVHRLVTPLYVEVPHLSGKVVDALTGDPLPGMDVCLLETYTAPNVSLGTAIKIRRSEAARTDAAGMFSFAASKMRRDLLEERDGYGIGVTDPAALWASNCGRLTDFLGGSNLGGEPDLFRSEIFNPKKDGHLPYFPLAVVPDNGFFPRIDAYFPDPSVPRAVLLRKMGDPGNIKVELFPLLLDVSKCQLIESPYLPELCSQANSSGIADILRKSWGSPTRHR